MKRKGIWIDIVVSALLPLALFGADYLNLLAFVFGLHQHETAREIVVFGIIAVAMLLMLVKVFLLWQERPSERKTILSIAAVPVLFAAIQVLGVVNSPDKAYIIKQMLVNGCYLVLACSGTLVVYLERWLQKFLNCCKRYAIAAMPVVLFYCIRFYVADMEQPESLGIMPYMQLAYLLLAICTTLIAEQVLYSRKENRSWGMKWNIPLSMLFLIAITLSGTKGALVCAGIGAVIVCVYAIKGRGYGKRMLLLPVLTLVIIALFSTVLFPGSSGDSRLTAMLKEALGLNRYTISSGELLEIVDPTQATEATEPHSTQPTTPAQSTTPIQPTAPDNTEPVQPPQSTLVQAGINLQKPAEIIAYFESNQAAQDFSEGKITKEDYETLVALYRNFSWTSTGVRNYLWNGALREIQGSPILGLGPYGFFSIYGMDPHNFLLEIAVDCGIPILILILCLGIFTFIKMIGISFKNEYVAVFAIYVLTFLFQRMVSGSLYDYMTFFHYGISVVIAIRCCKRKTKK